jgi:ribosomal protein S24E
MEDEGRTCVFFRQSGSTDLLILPDSDILHPGRANISKEDLRDKLAGMYKAAKEQVNVFGLRTQFGGGKTTGFALVYDSPEAMKKFEPNYRLVRVGLATKVERASRQQREWPPSCISSAPHDTSGNEMVFVLEPTETSWIEVC